MLAVVQVEESFVTLGFKPYVPHPELLKKLPICFPLRNLWPCAEVIPRLFFASLVRHQESFPEGSSV